MVIHFPHCKPSTRPVPMVSVTAKASGANTLSGQMDREDSPKDDEQLVSVGLRFRSASLID